MEAIKQVQDEQGQEEEGGGTKPGEAATKGIRVFVYGTLKKGEANHAVLRGSDFLGVCTIGPGYAMVDLGWYPGVVRDLGSEHEVSGEVYRVDEPTLHSLDAIEGHPTFYKRVKVSTPWKSAWVYTLPSGYLEDEECRRISSGEWHGRSN